MRFSLAFNDRKQESTVKITDDMRFVTATRISSVPARCRLPGASTTSEYVILRRSVGKNSGNSL